MRLCRSSGSPVEALYYRLCRENGIDSGDPHSFDSHVRFDGPQAKEALDAGDPYSLVDRACNLLTVQFRDPIAFCRVIRSYDAFDSAADTHIAWHYGSQTEFVVGAQSTITDAAVENLRRMWAVVDGLWVEHKILNRIVNALTYFQYAWRASYMEQICLNLVIVLESLFAPHHQGELTHQVAFNTAHFAGRDPEERRAIYRYVKKLYGERSRVVHGGLPNVEGIIDPTVQAFHLCADVLGKILLDQQMSEIFSDEGRRRELMESYMFDREEWEPYA